MTRSPFEAALVHLTTPELEAVALAARSLLETRAARRSLGRVARKTLARLEAEQTKPAASQRK